MSASERAAESVVLALSPRAAPSLHLAACMSLMRAHLLCIGLAIAGFFESPTDCLMR